MAAKTWANLITEARETLQDSQAPYRYSDTILTDFLNNGLQELARIRPDAFWDRWIDEDVLVPRVLTVDPNLDTDTETLSSPDDDEVALGDAVSDVVPMQFYNPLVFYLIGRAELIEDEFSTDGRAMAFMGQFKSSVLGL